MTGKRCSRTIRGLSGPDAAVPLIGNSQYGKPFIFQTPRSMRLAVQFTF